MRMHGVHETQNILPWKCKSLQKYKSGNAIIANHNYEQVAVDVVQNVEDYDDVRNG